MSYKKYMSYVAAAKPQNLIYSLLASYGEERGQSLAGSWFVAALSPFGHQADAVRQTLYRMTRDGALETRRLGIHKLYRLSRLGRASTDAGTARLFSPPETEWDGGWTLANYRFDRDERRLRDLVRGLLSVEGFALLSRGTYIHPRNRTQRLLESLAGEAARARVEVFRAQYVGCESNRALVHRLWDVDGIRRGYQRFISKFGPLARRRRWSRCAPHEPVALRFAVVLSYLETAWMDPELPLELLPRTWPSLRAHTVANRLLRHLRTPLLEYGDHVVQSLAPDLRKAVAV